MYSLGILGVGELTEKVVIGLRRSGHAGPILLSPRNAERAQTLADEQRCLVLPSNQALVERADVLILGVRPEALAQVAAEVRLRPGQHLVSLAAGVSLAQLAGAFPGARCVRVMLSYAAQSNQTTVVVCPHDPLIEQCLGPLGQRVVLEDEAAFELATVAACMNGWFYFLLHDLQQWLAGKGLPDAQARELVLGNLQDCLSSARAQPGYSLKALGEAIATPGTFTAQGLAVLQQQPGWDAACEVVLGNLRKRAQ
ncbi:NAD(P)-binding domain-containing protein [Pseudomonas sp. KU43P]|uniref:NAD(P)-binding domain-containing protein n=1 Tax=Pseudomonas sp. KU43P TaxID=2487887 RepID=UPI0012AA4BC4|nr:NAD(P)-binding domain-containing protein [Pseudomonas sp. KU43P]BBH45562.1 pyrroline-5-carboxylate reductase [Pseudomonas sp. KU43P]